MQPYKLAVLMAAFCCHCLTSFGDILTFIAQPAAAGGDNNWFNSVNWFTTDSTGNLVPAGRVPLTDDGAVITGLVDLQAGGVRVQTLVATNNSTIANGMISVGNIQLLSSCTITNDKIYVLTDLTVGGTNCVLNGTALTLLATASGTLQAMAPGIGSLLVLTQGTLLQNEGVLVLRDGSQISGGGTPQSLLAIETGTVLAVTNSASVRGAATGHLIIDNSGTVRVDGGSLTFADGIDWTNSSGTEQFQAAGPGSTVLFGSPFHVDSGVTSLFTGNGTNRWLSGASIDGLVQVSVIDPSSQTAGPGHLEIFDSVSGAGMLHVSGTTNQGGVGSWNNGTLSLAAVSIDMGGTLLIGGTNGSVRQLSGSVVTNLGVCTFWGGGLDFGQGAVFNNQAGASFVVQSDGILSSSAGGGVFNNLGTFEKTATGITQFGTTNSSQGPAFNNSGLLDLRAGELYLTGGLSTGEFRQQQGSLLWFWGGAHTLGLGASFTGTNTVRLSQGVAPAEWLLNESVAVGQLEVGSNAVVDATGAPSTAPIQFDSLLTHDNAVISNGTFEAGSFQMLDSSRLASATMTIGTNLMVEGTNCVLEATRLKLPVGSTAILQASSPGLGVVLNLAQGSVLDDGGQVRLTDGSVIARDASPQNGVIVEPGAVFSSSGSGVSIVGADFKNSGQVEIMNGTLDFQGALTQTLGTTLISSGATLGGTNFTLLGGTISGSGTINANLVNSGGTVSPGAPLGILSSGSGFGYQQNAGATFSVEVGGIQPGNSFAQFAVGGSVSLAGQLAISFVNGFVPQPGETFEVLTCTSLTGQFANIISPPLAGDVLAARYTPSGVTLSLTAGIQLSAPVLSGSTLSFQIATTPGSSYLVQMTDELNPPNWQTTSTFTGDGTIKTITQPLGRAHQFYRVLVQ